MPLIRPAEGGVTNPWHRQCKIACTMGAAVVASPHSSCAALLCASLSPGSNAGVGRRRLPTARSGVGHPRGPRVGVKPCAAFSRVWLPPWTPCGYPLAAVPIPPAVVWLPPGVATVPGRCVAAPSPQCVWFLWLFVVCTRSALLLRETEVLLRYPN